MMISDSLLEQIIEGALMASGHPMSVERIQSLFDEADVPDASRVEQALQRLGERSEHKGYELKKVATGYRFQVKESVVKWVSRLWEEKPQRYSRALLETLSIIAYRQPVTRGEIEEIRGVAVSSHITKTLLEREWVQVVGHRDVPGRPAMYATTKMFLDYFNMESLDQLPTLDEIQEIADANHALAFEDKVEEGNYDLSHTADDSESEAALESAAQDMLAAEAIVAQVEENVFRKPEEDEEADHDEAQAEATGLENAADAPAPRKEKTFADLADAIGAHQDRQKEKQQGHELDAEDELSANEDALEQAILLEQASGQSHDHGQIEDADEQGDDAHEAIIARMLAEQEALLQAKADADDSLATHLDAHVDQHADTHVDTHLSTNDAQPASHEFANDATTDFDASQKSVFAESYASADPAAADEEDEDALLAAMEEEAAALLAAEQEELLAMQDAEQAADEHQQPKDKSLADLANKYTTELE